MGYGGDVYSSPEKHGLEVLGDVQWGEANYDFDMTVVWRDPATGQLFYADDSGCSCPAPFEDYKSRDDLTAATRHEVLAHLTREGYETDAADLIERVANLPATP